jgi:GNAT superfamily N-acetyltransferase
MPLGELGVERATREDLATVLGWLEREYRRDGEGFWCNRNIIRRSFDRGELWIARHNGKAVAFQVGNYAPDILCVRKDRRHQGFGSALFEAALARAYEGNVNVLSGECSPPTSLPFWEKHGFERYGDMSDWGKIIVRRVLQRHFDIPASLPRATVAIAFFPESASYRQVVAPLAVHKVKAGRLADGALMLERRVIGLADDEPERRDLVVKIEVDDVVRCLCKAKYDEAQKAGVRRDYMGNTFYIDVVSPPDS